MNDGKAGGDTRYDDLSEEAIEDLRRRIVYAVNRSCPSWLSSQAEDIVQTVLVRLIQATKKSEGNKSYSAMYLEKAAYGSTVDEIRRRYEGRAEMMVEYPVGQQSPLGEALEKLTHRKWRG